MKKSRKYKIDENPQISANIFNRIFFWWLKSLFDLARIKTLEISDLYKILPEDQSHVLGNNIERNWREEINDSKRNQRNPSLLRASWKIFRWTFMYYGIHVFIICVILRGLLPYVLSLLIKHFDRNSDTIDNQAYIYAFTLIIMIIAQAIIGHHSVVGRKVIGMKISISYSALIYRKSLRLSTTVMNKYDIGKMMNLLSNDLSKFEDLCMFLHYIWILPIQGIVMGYFMWKSIGIASLTGIFFLSLQTFFLQGYLGKLMGKLRSEVASKTDKRVRLISEIIDGIRIIKMYAWEKPFEQLVKIARKYEIDKISLKSYLRVLSVTASNFAESISLFFVITTYVLLGNILEASLVYSLIQYFGMIKVMMVVFFPRALSSCAEARVSINRIEEFLSLDEVNIDDCSKRIIDDLKAVSIENLSVTWKDNSEDIILKNINLEFSHGKLYMVTGLVGSGKSTLLKSILQEIKPLNGSVKVTGKVSYVSQNPWILPDTIRNNIIFNETFDSEKYKKVLNACALFEDFGNLPNDDSTIVGNQGCTLSGGQCARINLARAIYRDADIYLIDDALAAVDANVGQILFDDCINGLLKDKIRILVTHDDKYFEKADEFIILHDGRVHFCGSYADMQARMNSEDFFITKIPTYIDQSDKKESYGNKEHNQDANDLHFIAKTEEKQKINKNEKSNYIDSTFWKYFRAGGSIFIISCLLLSLILAQASVSCCDYWLAHWVKKAGNEHCEIFIEDLNSDLKFALYIFAVLLFTSVILWAASSLLFYKICMNASRNLHDRMFSHLLRAPVRFFDINPPGRILNRFSKDTGLIDETLPTLTLDALHVILMTCGVIIQVLIINWWSIVPIIVVGTICWKIKNVYLPTAQTLRRLESQAKSPVFSHIHSTINGLVKIRSFEAQEKMIKKFDSLQDTHTSSYYINIVASSAFGFWLDIVSISLLAFIIICFILVKNNENFAGIVGLAITQVMMLYGSVQYGLRQTTEMITQMISVERIFQFIDLEQEGPFYEGFRKLPNNWPNDGRIVFDDLSLKYSSNEDSVLKNITLSIEANEKIGIVGRTGAGKTSLVSALFRLFPTEGSLKIDDIDIKTVGLYDLRSSISIIPQDPVLFSESLRNNIDPLHKQSDEFLWYTLKKLKLEGHFNTLDDKIENRGDNFSSGQKQLLCLARVILNRNKILILDEATASVDLVTEKFIQQLIKNLFSDCTILTIAHRLKSVLTCDKVLVIDKGLVVDYDSPSNLLKKEGYLRNLINNRD